ncbi:MAG: hypothetical protein H0T57_13450 [Rubrobacter sp.]|nr:hypothetical protein [Rubrobacter sp.]MDQ3637236.1 hypothetical protein [Actinomycetota bacterium]
MENERQGAAADSTSIASVSPRLGATLLRVAWLSILLGFVMEALKLTSAAGFGTFTGLDLTVVADLVGQISWSTIVCVGLAIGTAVSKFRASLMGFLGLLAAPLAFGVSRSLHQGAAQSLAIWETASGPGPSLYILAVLKAVEYACLGAALGWIGSRHWGGVLAHVAVGLVVGIFFGGAIVAATYWTSPESPGAAALIVRGFNELVFPVGCSLVLFSAQALGKRVSTD